MHAPVNERNVNHQATQNEQQRVQVLQLGLINDRADDKVSRNHEDDDWNDNRHLIWTWVVGLGEAHHNQCQHGTSVENPCGETEEVNQ